MNPKCMDEIKEFCKNNDLGYEEFGEVPKPILPVLGDIFRGGMHVGGGAFHGGGFGLGPSFSFGVGILYGAPIDRSKKPPIKYAPVSFPYSKTDE
jgi:hypothetical protein